MRGRRLAKLLGGALRLEVTPDVLAVFFRYFRLFDGADFARRDAAQAARPALVGGVAGACGRAAEGRGVHRADAAARDVCFGAQLRRIHLFALAFLAAGAAVVVGAGAAAAVAALALAV